MEKEDELYETIDKVKTLLILRKKTYTKKKPEPAPIAPKKETKPVEPAKKEKPTKQKKKESKIPDPKKGEAVMTTFTGLRLCLCKILKTGKTMYLIETPKGKLKFDKKTLKQVDAKNPKFANKIILG
ncbi:hypothetical protein D3C73_1291200 [compost metagenome]